MINLKHGLKVSICVGLIMGLAACGEEKTAAPAPAADTAVKGDKAADAADAATKEAEKIVEAAKKEAAKAADIAKKEAEKAKKDAEDKVKDLMPK